MGTYFIQGETLTGIADAIREKAGLSAALFPENMPSYIRAIQTASSDTSDIPEDIVTEAKRVASSMVSKRGANALTAVIMSDMHEFGDGDHSDATIMERYRRANRNAGQGAKIVADNIDIDFFANLGDLTWGAKTSTITDFVQGIMNARSYMNDVMKDHETFLTPGNHDTATYGYEQNGEYLSQGMTDGLIGTYRYVDFDTKKVRVICLNTAEVEGLTVSGASGTERITGTQLQWFADSLDLSDKDDAAEWGIVILSHHPLDWGTILPAANCLQAYLAGSSYSVTHNGVAVSKDFSGVNAAKVICQFHGHVHGFRVDYIQSGTAGSLTPTTVQRIAIPNACFARNNEYGENSGTDSNGIEFGEETTYAKTDDSTGKNTAFCLVSIDLDKKIIYADCFGAGYDRTISYGEEEVVTYSVTNDLTNASTSNGAATVTAGSGYTAAITANDGYELESVTVTMGGVDITATAVSGGNITIASVTGDIVITAAAVATDDFEYGEFTNLVPTAQEMSSTAVYNSVGYKDGYRLSSSSPFESAASGYVITGYIPYTVEVDGLPGTIYIKGAAWNEVSNCRLTFFTAAKTEICGPQLVGGKTDNGALAKSYTVETLGDDYFCLVPVDAGSGKWAAQNIAATVTNTGFFRISLAGSGENLIITVDEQIHK